jgi:type VII secretion integral membrane protein EccD
VIADSVRSPGAPRSTRVTVVGERRRVDVSIPPVALAEALPELVRLIAASPAADDGTPGAWSVTRLDGVPLDLEQPLSAAGVVDGELLYLVAEEPVEPAVVDDFAEAVAQVVEASGGQWRPGHLRSLLVWLGALLLAAGAIPLFSTGLGDVASTSVAVAVAAALALAAALLARPLRRPAPAGAVAVAALPWWAAGGLHLATLTGGGGAIALVGAATAGGLVVGCLAAWAAAPNRAGLAAGLLLAAAPPAVAGAAIGLGVAAPDQAAAVLAVVLTVGLGALPGLTARLGRLLAVDAFGERVTPRAAEVEADVRAARRLLGWLLAGAGLALVPALFVLALAPNGVDRLLCVVVVASIGLRARHHRFLAEVLPLALAAIAGAGLLAAGLLLALPGRVQVTAALIAGTLAVGAGALAGDGGLSAQARRRLSLAEVAANLALLPLALWATGAFAALAAWARGL